MFLQSYTLNLYSELLDQKPLLINCLLCLLLIIYFRALPNELNIYSYLLLVSYEYHSSDTKVKAASL